MVDISLATFLKFVGKTALFGGTVEIRQITIMGQQKKPNLCSFIWAAWEGAVNQRSSSLQMFRDVLLFALTWQLENISS